MENILSSAEPCGLLVYITCANLDEAQRIADALLEARLIACANMLTAPMLSFYTWKGRREQTREILLLAKTMEDRFPDLRQKVRELHSYETPCITALPITTGDPDFLAWIKDSTRAC